MQLSEWLSYQAPKIRSNCKIVTVDCAYHISSNKNIKRFMPMIGNRMAESEDRTIARVCCAATVLDAIRGHSAVAWEQLDAWFDGQFDEFAIYQFPFTEYIKPNRKLVYDAEVCTQQVSVKPTQLGGAADGYCDRENQLIELQRCC